jgi:CHAT domain-containing protein
VDGQPLGQRNIVSYLPSAGVLRHCLASRGTAGSDVVILADATSTRPLPLAHDQALALGGLLAAHQRSVRCYTGDAATLRALEGNLGDGRAPGLAHFAVHGFTDPSTGLDSGLRLADGPLTARRLVGLRLGGALVCLGACETGISERLAGDELLGLVRSALYAGAGSVVASLWPVDQLSSSMLMLDFHQGVLDGVGKAAALHAAQLRLCAATVTDVLAHLAMARERLAGDMRADILIGLAEASLRLAARDVDAAMAAVSGVLSRSGLTETDTRQAAEASGRIRLAARQPGVTDYARHPFGVPEHWAPFMVIGDAA